MTWPSSQASWTYSENAMVYNLGDHSVAYSTKSPQYATYAKWSSGPTFGHDNYDVSIDGDLKRGTCALGGYYAYVGYASSTTRTCGGAKFEIKKMEIWHLAPPATPAPHNKMGAFGVFAATEDGAVQVSTIASSAEMAAVSFAAGLDPTRGMWARCYVYRGEVGYHKTPSDFHSRCDGKGPTVTLARLATYGRRFAAYAPASWNSSSDYIPGIDTMLYSLDTERHAFSVKSDQYAMYDNPDYFPTFGNGKDLYISASGAVSCRMNGAFYARTNGLNNFELCSNGEELEEMEVWYLKKQPTVELMLAELSIGGAHVGRSSNVASAQEVMAVSMITGYSPRAELWKMCYDVATDTNTSQKFHDKCDNMGPTLTLISLQNGRRLAAYAQHSWDGNTGRISGDKNVLYSFNEKKYRISKSHSQYGQYSSEIYGPRFGYNGYDFSIGTDMTKVKKCGSHSFSGPATNVDVCGDLGDGGGNVVHLEVYVVGEAWRNPIPSTPCHYVLFTCYVTSSLVRIHDYI